jgi:HNH endonuclease
MSDDASVAVRRLVSERAADRCEYCLLHSDDSFTPQQIDHIISRKHGGDSSPENLALACVRCNAWKGSDIAGYGSDPGKIVALFHPRRDRWRDHFRLEEGVIVPLTGVGTATIRLLTERQILIRSGRYPRERHS